MAINEKQYASKVDWWLGALIVFLFVGGIASVIAGVWFLIKAETISGLSYIGYGVLSVGIIVILVYPLHYTLTQDELIIRYGLLRSRYKYEKLTGVVPSKNPLSSPALSLDRLKITYKGKVGFFMISPKDKEDFMKELALHAPHLEYSDGKVRLKEGHQ